MDSASAELKEIWIQLALNWEEKQPTALCEHWLLAVFLLWGCGCPRQTYRNGSARHSDIRLSPDIKIEEVTAFQASLNAVTSSIFMSGS